MTTNVNYAVSTLVAHYRVNSDTGFVAQWYADGERCGQAFPLLNTGELLFFAYFTEAPMIVPDDATRAMLCERGYNVLSTAS